MIQYPPASPSPPLAFFRLAVPGPAAHPFPPVQVQAGLEGGVSHMQTIDSDYISTLVKTPARFTLLSEDGTEAGSYQVVHLDPNPQPSTLNP